MIFQNFIYEYFFYLTPYISSIYFYRHDGHFGFSTASSYNILKLETLGFKHFSCFWEADFFYFFYLLNLIYRKWFFMMATIFNLSVKLVTTNIIDHSFIYSFSSIRSVVSVNIEMWKCLQIMTTKDTDMTAIIHRTLGIRLPKFN